MVHFLSFLPPFRLGAMGGNLYSCICMHAVVSTTVPNDVFDSVPWVRSKKSKIGRSLAGLDHRIYNVWCLIFPKEREDLTAGKKESLIPNFCDIPRAWAAQRW